MVLLPAPRSRIAQLSMANPLKGRSGLLERRLLGCLPDESLPSFFRGTCCHILGWKWTRNWKYLDVPEIIGSKSDSAIPGTAAPHPQAPLSVGSPRQEYWSGLPFPSPGVFPTQGSNPWLLHCRRVLHPWATREASETWHIIMWSCHALKRFLEVRWWIKSLGMSLTHRD